MKLVAVGRSLIGKGSTVVMLAGLLVGNAVPCVAQQSASAGGAVRIGGSSTVHPILEEAIREFRQEGRAEARAAIQLSEDGTTGGFRRFCQGQLLIAAASRPIKSLQKNQPTAQFSTAMS